MTHTTDIRLDLSRGHWALGEFEEAVIALERRALEGPLDETVLELANRFLDDLGGADAEGSLAGRLRRLVEQGFVEKDETIILFNTGSGYKYMHLVGDSKEGQSWK